MEDDEDSLIIIMYHMMNDRNDEYPLVCDDFPLYNKWFVKDKNKITSSQLQEEDLYA